MQTRLELLNSSIGPQDTAALLEMAKSRGLSEKQTIESIDALLSTFCSESTAGGHVSGVAKLIRYKAKPVGVREFIESKFYLGKGDEVYPTIMCDLIELNSGKYEEAVLTGGVGSGKTTIALYSQAYQLYLLSCLRSPHQLFGLDSSSEIKIIFQNINLNLARGVDFARFKDMISGSPYFQRHFMFNPNINSKLIFPNRIEVEPVSGSETASIGQNVIGGCFPPTQKFLRADGVLTTMGDVVGTELSCYTIDDLNFMRPSQMTKVVATGFKQIIRLTFDNGAAIDCTADQRFKDIHGNWVTAKDAHGRNFKFVDLQTVQCSSDILDSASTIHPQDDWQGVQRTVPTGEAYRAEDGRASAVLFGLQGQGTLPSVPAAPTPDNGPALDYTRPYPTSVQRAIPADPDETRECACFMVCQVEGACAATALRPGFQEVSTDRHIQGTTPCPRSDQGVTKESCLYREPASQDASELGQQDRPRTGGALTKVLTKNIQLCTEPRSCGGTTVQVRDGDSLSTGQERYSVGVRDRAFTLHGGRREKSSIHTRLHDQLRPYRSKVGVYDTEKPGTVGREVSGHINTAFESCDGHHVKTYGVITDTSVVGQECSSGDNPYLRNPKLEMGQVRCTSVSIVSEDLTPVYDLENSGPTHTFFALTEGFPGFLIAHQCIDEINFMAVVENSKSSSDGGTYDQAIELYNTIARRRKSRFMKDGSMPGLLCLVSSKRTPGQFTDKKEEEAKTNPSIYVYNKRMWDIKPDSFCGDKFRVFVGDDTRKPRVYLEGESVALSEVGYIDHIPTEFLPEFKDDITKALRDIAGRSTLAVSPFMPDTERVVQNFGKRRSLCTQNKVDFVEYKTEIIPSRINNLGDKRFCHLDLALRGDSAGVVIGHIPRFISVDRGNNTSERLPVIEIDMAVEVSVPRGGEIEFSNIRRLLYRLRELGLPIHWVTLDSYQCISANALVWTDHGLISPKDVQPGMVVQSRSGPKPVTKKWEFQNKPVVKVTTTDGISLEMTHGHKIEIEVGHTYVKGGARQLRKSVWGWVQAMDLKVGDTVRTWNALSTVDVPAYIPLPPCVFSHPNSVYIHTPTHLTPDFAEFLGLIWGDGDITCDSIRLTTAVGEDQDAMRVFVRSFGKAPTLTKCTDRDGYCLVQSSRPLVAWLKVCGLEKTDNIPELLKRSPKDVQIAFIRGLFSTDGSVSKEDGGVSYSTRHRLWAEYVHTFLGSTLGIQSCITSVLRKDDCYKTDSTHQYLLSIRGPRELFASTVGFTYEAKTKALNAHLSVRGRGIKVKIASISNSPNTDVYDFEVQDDHSYVVNGLVSHNSVDTMQILRSEGFITGYQSMDVTMIPYQILKRALYDGRVHMDYHPKLQHELVTLEQDFKRGRIDHSAHGCAFGTVKVHCIDGQSRSFEELTTDYEQGIEHMGLTWDSAINCARPALLEKPHIAKYVQELVEIEFDNGLSVKFTPEHLFLLENGGYVEAQNLLPEHLLQC